MSCTRLHNVSLLGLEFRLLTMEHVFFQQCANAEIASPQTPEAGRIPSVNVSHVCEYRYHPGPYGYERPCGKNTGGLLSEASFGHKKIKIAVCASLK